MKEEKYFSQNISFSLMNLSNFGNIEIKNINDFPKKSDLDKLSTKNFYKNDNSMEDIILFVRTLLTPLFRQIMSSNIVSGKIPCTSGGSLSIQGIKKWFRIYIYFIFKKQGGKKNIIFLLSLIYRNHLFYYVIILIL